LSNKWNAREFAVRHAARVPALYWFGRRTAAIPVERLPAPFVIRRVWGTTGNCVFVFAKGRELLRDREVSRQDLRQMAQTDFGRLSYIPWLVEEFVGSDGDKPALPVEYRFYTFGDTVAVIEAIRRRTIGDHAHGFYTPSWEWIDEVVNVRLPLDERREPPHCLDEMLAVARRLGSAYGTAVRVDQYATSAGAVFGEFSSIPHGGKNFTPFANDYLGEVWQRVFPDGV